MLASLLETTLALAKIERGYVFLTGAKGALELALGRDATGKVVTDAPTVSRTVLRQATRGTDQFIVTDTLTAEGEVAESIVAHNIHTIICIPLRRTRQTRDDESAEERASRQVFGALYLESRFQPGGLSDVDHDLMRTIAREAAALVDNAQLAAIEDQARKHQEELKIAERIQQGLMAVRIPDFPFARVQAHSVACSAVGGDFFDVISGEDTLNVALVDVSGKGISGRNSGFDLAGHDSRSVGRRTAARRDCRRDQSISVPESRRKICNHVAAAAPSGRPVEDPELRPLMRNPGCVRTPEFLCLSRPMSPSACLTAPNTRWATSRFARGRELFW